MITVGLPFHNHRDTLLDAIRSVFAQTHADWELLLIDDGSSDGSYDIASRVRDDRVRLISDKVNRGLAARLNQITRLATGKYVARMDADDVMHPDRLRRQLRYLEQDTSLDLVASSVVVIDAARVPRGIRSDEPLVHTAVAYLRHGRLIHPSVTGTRSWFLKYPYDELLRRSQDYELWCRAAPDSKFAKLAEPLLFYREVGVFNLVNYLSNGRADRDVLRRYGPPQIGVGRTQLRVVASHLKSYVYRLSVAAGIESYLVRRRGRPLTDEETASSVDALRRVAATRVPGIERERHTPRLAAN